MWFQKISIPTPQMVTENSKGVARGGGGGGVSKAKIFKGKYEPKLEFSEGWGSGGLQNKKKSMGEDWYGYSLEQHNVKIICLPGIEYSALTPRSF